MLNERQITTIENLFLHTPEGATLTHSQVDAIVTLIANNFPDLQSYQSWRLLTPQQKVKYFNKPSIPFTSEMYTELEEFMDKAHPQLLQKLKQRQAIQ